MSKKYLISFASPDLKKSARRYYDQSKEMNFYDDIYVFSISDLEERHQKFIFHLLKNNKKNGYGYWFWKPLIISQFLERIKENDIINYTDIGCHFNKNGINRLHEYIEKIELSEKGILAFQYNPLEDFKGNSDFEFPDIKEYIYTKADLFEYLGVLKNREITHSNQFWAGNIFFKKNLFTKNFLNKWLDIFEKRFDLIDDTSSKLENFKDFSHHKHDQSAFSILCKLNKINSISAYECEWFYKNGVRYWNHTQNSPIIAKRDKKYNFIKRFINRQKRTLRRYKSKFFKS